MCGENVQDGGIVEILELPEHLSAERHGENWAFRGEVCLLFN